MSGKFTRNYDQPCSIIQHLHQSIRPAQYNMYAGQYKNCRPCLNSYGSVPTGRYNDSKNKHLVDIESKLKGQSTPDYDCGREKTWDLDVYQPDPDFRAPCSKLLVPEESLMTLPKSYFTELQIDRFYDLPIDNDDWVYWGDSVNTKQMAKDAFVQKYPKPLSINPSLPPAQRSKFNNQI
jgi:hypothetical protein